MAITPVAGGRKSGRGRRGVPRYGAMADINMTPFIDVMLVLLIIFMVAAPLLTTGVSVDLPRASATALNVERKPIAVSLNEQGQLYVMDEPIADADLVSQASSRLAERRRSAHLLRASKTVPYGRVAEIMAAVTTAGLQEGGPRHRADQTIAGSGVGRAAVIFGFCRLRRAAWRVPGAAPARIRLGAEIRGQSGSRSRSKPSSLSELNQITNGEKDAKPAPQPAPAPPTPPQPPPDLRASAEQTPSPRRRRPRLRRNLRPPPKPEPPPPPKAEATPPPEPEPTPPPEAGSAAASKAAVRRPPVQPPLRPKIARSAARTAEGAGAGEAETAVAQF